MIDKWDDERRRQGRLIMIYELFDDLTEDSPTYQEFSRRVITNKYAPELLTIWNKGYISEMLIARDKNEGAPR